MSVLDDLEALEAESVPLDGPHILRQQKRRSELIVKAREAGYSLQAVAKAAGVSPQHVCRVLEWETRG